MMKGWNWNRNGSVGAAAILIALAVLTLGAAAVRAEPPRSGSRDRRPDHYRPVFQGDDVRADFADEQEPPRHEGPGRDVDRDDEDQPPPRHPPGEERPRRPMRPGDRPGGPPPDDDGEGFPPPEPGMGRPPRGEGGAPPGGPRDGRPRDGGPDDADGGPGRFRPDGPQRGVPDGLINDIMEVLEKHFPEMHERLSALRISDPEEFQRRIRRLRPFVLRILQADPETRELLIEDHKIQMQIDEKLKAFHAGGSTDAAGMQNELRPLLDKQFDLRMEKHRRLIADIEKRLQSQKTALDKRLAAKSKLIDSRLQELTRERSDEMRWPEP